MNLRTQLSSGTGMAKFLAEKKHFKPICDTESGLHIFDDQEISEKLKKFLIEKIGKNEFDLGF